MEPRWLPLCTCRALRRSSRVCLSDTPLVPHHQEGAFKTICLLGEFFHALLLQLLYNSLGIKPLPSPPPSPTLSFLKPTPDLTTRKRSHFWEVTSMHVPCWVVTFDFLRPFMSHTHQPRELQAHLHQYEKRKKKKKNWMECILNNTSVCLPFKDSTDMWKQSVFLWKHLIRFIFKQTNTFDLLWRRWILKYTSL